MLVCHAQERPIDIVVDGFVHLQQYHVREIARGLAGCGTYQLQDVYTVCDMMPPSQTLTLAPENIVDSLRQPTAQVWSYVFANFK